jgi:phosphoglycerate dehydrogenase-like enzyme
MRVLFVRREATYRLSVPGAEIVEARPGEEPGGDFDALIGARIPPEILDRYPSLRFVLIPFAGIPPQDLETVSKRPRLTLLNSHYNAPYVAEHAFSMLLALAKKIVLADRRLRLGDWTVRNEQSMTLRGATCGIVGFGAVGRRIDRLAQAFEMRTRAVRRAGDGEIPGAEGLPDLLRQSDAVFISAPLTADTRGMIGKEELALLKPGAALVNVARADIVQEEPLYLALRENRISAAIDAWYSYPGARDGRFHFPSRFPFHQLDNVVLSPHRSAHAEEAERARMEDLARQIGDLASGRPPSNVVDCSRGY